MIYLYAITDSPPAALEHEGLDGAPVDSLALGDLHVVHSRHPAGFEPQVNPYALWAHEAVVDELLERGAVVPFRFGTTLRDGTELEVVVARESRRFQRSLADLRDRVELAVRVWVEQPAAAATADDGASYLAARRSRDQIVRSVLAPLERAAAASTLRAADRLGVVRASYLVDRGELGDFTERVRGLQEEHPQLALSCTGPWAPYSFVGDPEA